MTRVCPDCGGPKAYQSDRCRTCATKRAVIDRAHTIETGRDLGFTPNQVADTIGIARREVARWCRRHHRDDLAAWIYPNRYTATCTQCHTTPVARDGASCHDCTIAMHDRESPYELTDGAWITNHRGIKTWIEGAA